MAEFLGCLLGIAGFIILVAVMLKLRFYTMDKVHQYRMEEIEAKGKYHNVNVDIKKDVEIGNENK